MKRKELIRALGARIGGRKLVWFGTRGEDCRALLDLPQFSEVFSLIAPFGSLAMRVDECLETRTKMRVDLDTYDLDADTSEPARDLRRLLFKSLSEPAVLVPYRPLAFLSSVQYPRSEYVEYLGLFHERQAPFEHKPWVESELRRIGVPVVPWRYYTDEDRRRVAEQIESIGAIVLRSNRSDGGVGLTKVDNPAGLDRAWRGQADGFLAVAPLLWPHIPLNVSACAFPDGAVSLHPPSLQLLGLASCTNRPFGYCGNDFAAARNLNSSELESLEDIVRRVGRWLAATGYIGAFGVDAMVYDGEVLLAEVNPRFQGSSAISAQIDAELGRPDIFLSHLSAFWGLPAGRGIHLVDLVNELPIRSQIICHNCGNSPKRRISLVAGEANPCTLLPSEDIAVQPEAVLFRQMIEQQLTHDGFTIGDEHADRLQAIIMKYFGQMETTENWRSTRDATSTPSTPYATSRQVSAADRSSDYRRPVHAISGGGSFEPPTNRTEP